MPASFTTLTPPDDVVFSATRPCIFTLVGGVQIISGTVNFNGQDMTTITGSVITNHSNEYTVTAAQPDVNWVYTVTPTNGWPAATMQVVITSGNPGPVVQSRNFTVGEGYIPDHTQTALDRMLDQFDGSVNLRALASSYVDQVQELEDAATQLLHDRHIDTASGLQLDGIGQIVNVTRGGLEDDPEYRLRLKAELAILFSQGSLNEILTVVQLLIPSLSDGDIEAAEYYPKTLYLRPVDHALTEDPQTIATLLRRAVPAATELHFIYTTTENDDEDLFRFSDTLGSSETSSSHGYGNGTFTGAA